MIHIGSYTYVKLSKVQLGYLFVTKGIKSYSMGSEIVLKKDSTFTRITCGNIINGKWYQVKDSLFLKTLNIRWRSDSLEKYGLDGKWPSIPIKPIGFKIDNDCLEKIFVSNKGDKVIERLKFNVP